MSCGVFFCKELSVPTKYDLLSMFRMLLINFEFIYSILFCSNYHSYTLIRKRRLNITLINFSIHKIRTY